MTEPRQRTLARSVTLDGIGVHSGQPAAVTIRPADAGTGIRFRRTDLTGTTEIPATLEHVVATDLGTALGAADVRVLTVEHALAALSAQAIDNAVLEVAGPELPIRDGSFLDYVTAVADAGTVEQPMSAFVIDVTDPITLQTEGGTSYVVTPSDRLQVSVTIDFDHPLIGRQFGTFEITAAAFARELGPARTFGFRSDAYGLRARGLALGASLDNTVVLDDAGGILNDGLRFADEFVRHKAGDLVGDLALLGARLRGHVVAERPSHKGNVALARTILRNAPRRGGPVLDIAKIMKMLPHRYPMLLVDRILEIEPGKRIVGIKNVSINEPFFQGHYPGHPIMPGVLQIEAMAQVGGLLMMDSPETAGKLVYFMTLDNVKWRKPVTPGDQIVYEVELLQLKRSTCRMRGKGTVDGNVVVEAEMMAMLVDP
ncbi:MAG: UDP-3-O-[3-hydroxymyristoyl] N-acetylglucosamine deacetylase [Gemmatimonadetes bacterium]|nr:UDP-3-O-[3-hydroxymyristoyl] N-acetylglucosamine deacetylase [Gemmatimonadota bacterium]